MLEVTAYADKAISFGTGAGLKDCEIVSCEVVDEEHHFIVEGQFGEIPDSASDKDRRALEKLLSDPWQLRVVIKDGCVIRDGWVNVSYTLGSE